VAKVGKPSGTATGKTSQPAPPKATLAPANVAPAPRPELNLGTASSDISDREQRLRAEVEAILRAQPLSGSHLGLLVADVATGQTKLDVNGARPYCPASNTKIVTVAAALAALGGEYRFRSVAYGRPPEAGVVRGDVTLRGTFDPWLRGRHLAELAERLVARGVARITGGIEVSPQGGVDAKLDPIQIVVTPGAKAGAAAHVSVSPKMDYIVLRSAAVRTVKGARSRVQVRVLPVDGRAIVEVVGTVGARSRGAAAYRAVLHPDLFAAHLLRDALVARGVVVEGEPHRAAVDPAPAAPPKVALAQLESEPLAVIVREANKLSRNGTSERLLEALGGETYGGAPSRAKGLAAAAEFLRQLGISGDQAKFYDGSGLSHDNRIAPAALVRLLRAIYLDPQARPDFLASLAVSGKDGTIRTRFLDSAAAGWVRAKTGTLTGVSTLSGFVGGPDQTLVFSILVNDFSARRTVAVRRAQVLIVEALWRYLWGDAAPAAGPRLTSAEAAADAAAVRPQESAAAASTEEVLTPGEAGEADETLVELPAPQEVTDDAVSPLLQGTGTGSGATSSARPLAPPSAPPGEVPPARWLHRPAAK
jgi:D-alanyl-D-alanine carboxypeptidase/D-alanyl-D-alanine-endopeptidase (penicillin-binding protein 4)